MNINSLIGVIEATQSSVIWWRCPDLHARRSASLGTMGLLIWVMIIPTLLRVDFGALHH